MFLTVQTNNNFDFNSATPGTNERIIMVFHASENKYSLRSPHNKYLARWPSGNLLQWNRTSASGWEKFDIEREIDGKYVFKSGTTYLRFNGPGNISCSVTAIDNNTKFEIITYDTANTTHAQTTTTTAPVWRPTTPPTTTSQEQLLISSSSSIFRSADEVTPSI